MLIYMIFIALSMIPLVIVDHYWCVRQIIKEDGATTNKNIPPDENRPIMEPNKGRELIECIICGVALIGFPMLIFWFKQEYLPVIMIKWLILLGTLLAIAWMDYRYTIIPDHLLGVLLLLRIVTIIIECNQYGEYKEDLLLSYIVGAVVGGGVVFLVFALSKGVGFGDVKLFIIVGLIVGFRPVMELMVYCFTVSAVFSIALLALKKAKLKDTAPLAPFVLIGTILTVVL